MDILKFPGGEKLAKALFEVEAIVSMFNVHAANMKQIGYDLPEMKVQIDSEVVKGDKSWTIKYTVRAVPVVVTPPD